MASSHVWRKEYTDTRPESFTDENSRIARTGRFLKAMSLSFGIFLIAAAILSALFAVNFDKLNSGEIAQYSVGISLSGLISFYIGYAMIKIYKYRKK